MRKDMIMSIVMDIAVMLFILIIFFGGLFMSNRPQWELRKKEKIDNAEIVLLINGKEITTTINNIRNYALDNDNVVVINDLNK